MRRSSTQCGCCGSDRAHILGKARSFSFFFHFQSATSSGALWWCVSIRQRASRLAFRFPRQSFHTISCWTQSVKSGLEGWSLAFFISIRAIYVYICMNMDQPESTGFQSIFFHSVSVSHFFPCLNIHFHFFLLSAQKQRTTQA